MTTRSDGIIPNDAAVEPVHTDRAADVRPELPEMNRRQFLSTTAAVGGSMVVGFWMPGSTRCSAAQDLGPALTRSHVPGQVWYREAMVPELNAWITIAPDDTVT